MRPHVTVEGMGAQTGHQRTSHNTISEEKYEGLVVAYRGAPGAHSAVAKSTGLHVSTVRKYWLNGGGPHAPIKDLLEAENDVTRAALQRERIEAQATLEQAKGLVRQGGQAYAKELARDAMEDKQAVRIEEGRMANEARAVVAEHLTACRALMASTLPLQRELERRFSDPKELKAQSVDTLARYIRAVGGVAKQGVDAAKTAVELQRIIVGDPTRTVRVTFETDDEAKREIREGMEAARRAGLIDAEGRPIEVIDVPAE